MSLTYRFRPTGWTPGGLSEALSATLAGTSSDSGAISGVGEVSPSLQVLFENYTDTNDLINDSATWSTTEDLNPSKITLESDGPTGVDAKSMQYAFQGETDGNPLDVGRILPYGQEMQEVWWEVYVKWSSNYSLDSGDIPYAHKFIFGRVDNGNFRWSLIVPSGTTATTSGLRDGGGSFDGRPPGGANSTDTYISGVSPVNYWDENWYQLRMHWKSPSDDTTVDGRYEFWIDGTRHINETFSSSNLNNADVPIPTKALALGKNRDDIVKDTNHSDWVRWSQVQVWFEGNTPSWST